MNMQTVTLTTAGDGYWGTNRKTVKITDMILGYINDEHTFGELRVYFDTDTWDVNTDNLIYTDRGFLKELREFLIAHGLDGLDVSYSEQGMQGDDYVSLDIGAKFINTWESKFGTITLEGWIND